jgi:hypothetical protein
MAQSLFEDISVASAVDAIAMTANIANMHKYGIILTIRVQGSKVQTRAHAEHGDFSSVYFLP